MATLITKNSSTASSVPTAAQLVQGELAVNVTDKRLFTENSSGTVVELGTNPSTLALPNGSANGVAYLNGSKVLTTGSALTFDGTSFNIGNGTNTYTAKLLTNGLAMATDNTTYQYMGLCSSGVAYAGTATNHPYAFAINGSEQMRLTSTGLGIGTSSPSSKLEVSGAGSQTFKLTNTTGVNAYIQSYSTSFAVFGTSNNYPVVMAVNGGEVARFDTSGNLGIGTSSPSYKVEAIGSSPAFFGESSTNGTQVGYRATIPSNSSNCFVGWVSDAVAGLNGDLALCPRTSAGGRILFFTGSTTPSERARIDSSGNLLVGVTSGSSKLYVGSDTTSYSVTTTNANASPAGYRMYYGNATPPNNTGNSFLLCDDSATVRVSIRSNGGIANYSANDVNLSDRREKTNFAPAGEYLSKICAIPVQTFNYIDQNMEEDPGTTLGVVAQDVQAVAPELVMESNWGTKDEPKMRLSIYQTDLQYALMKALQELKAELDSVKSELAQLKGN